MKRTKAYQFTITDINDPRLVTLRQEIKKANKLLKSTSIGSSIHYSTFTKSFYTINNRLRISLRGRGRRTGQDLIDTKRKLWKQRYGNDIGITDTYLKKSLSQNLPPVLSEYIDVYIHGEKTYKD